MKRNFVARKKFIILDFLRIRVRTVLTSGVASLVAIALLMGMAVPVSAATPNVALTQTIILDASGQNIAKVTLHSGAQEQVAVVIGNSGTAPTTVGSVKMLISLPKGLYLDGASSIDGKTRQSTPTQWVCGSADVNNKSSCRMTLGSENLLQPGDFLIALL